MLKDLADSKTEALHIPPCPVTTAPGLQGMPGPPDVISLPLRIHLSAVCEAAPSTKLPQHDVKPDL